MKLFVGYSFWIDYLVLFVTDFDFADDIALLSEELYHAQERLQRVETSVAKVGLKMNAGKTKFMSFNQN